MKGNLTSEVSLRHARSDALEPLTQLVSEYHAFEGISVPQGDIEAAVAPLLGRCDLGRIWFIVVAEEIVGYAAVCFGYSIEFGGRDAFLDELFLLEAFRGRGIGQQALDLLKNEVSTLGIVALHLEVAITNERAQRLYSGSGFNKRNRFMLMTAPLTTTTSGESE